MALNIFSLTFPAPRHHIHRMPRALLILLFLLAPITSAAENKAPPLDRPERISFLDNGKIRLGVNLDLGGAITHLSPSDKPELNLINSHDWGRQIQMSHYAGPIPFEPAGKKPAEHWKALGWNPIQSGDCFGHRSKVVEHTNDGKSLHVKCIPMQWPLENEPGECTFEWRIELNENTASVRARLTNARSDKTQYRARSQELPALYTNGPWHRLMTYTGDKPFTGGALTQQPSKMPWSRWQATEHWAALVDDHDFGVGLISPDTFTFDGGFAGKTGKGGPKDGPTGYIAPISDEIIDHNIVYDYRFTLIFGQLDQIRAYAVEHAPKPAPPASVFQTDRQHWHYANATDSGWPIKGELNVKLNQKNPMLVSPSAFWRAAEAPKLYIQTAAKLSTPAGRVFWSRFDSPKLSSEKSLAFAIPADEKFHTIEIDLTASKEYTGTITGLRIDPGPGGADRDYIRIKSISFIAPK